MFGSSPEPTAVLDAFIAQRVEINLRFAQAFSVLWDAYRVFAIQLNTIPLSQNAVKQKLPAIMPTARLTGDGRILGARLRQRGL